jgi:hypothetical protein
VGAALLHALTLAGLFYLARRFFGRLTAVLAVGLYALSEHALFFAGSLWPIGHPAIYVWAVIFCDLWIEQRRAHFLALGLGVWAAGMYLDLAILPVGFIFLAPWVYARPPVRWKPLVAAGVAVLLLWWPYLELQASRGFIDLRSQLLQQPIFPADQPVQWCTPDLKIHTHETTAPTTVSALLPANPPQTAGLPSQFIQRLSNLQEKALAPFTLATQIPAAGILMLLMTLSTLILLATPATRSYGALWEQPWFLAAAAMLLAGLLGGAIGWTAAQLPGGLGFGPTLTNITRKLSTLLTLGGLGWLVGELLLAAVGKGLTYLRLERLASEPAQRFKILAFNLAVPWLVLLFAAELGKPERFLWLWPLQVLFITACLTYLLPRLPAPKVLIWFGVVAIIGSLLANGFLFSRLEAWRLSGWAGPQASEVQMVDTLARHVKELGQDRAAIGYHTYIYSFMATYNVTNPLYKVGAEFDLLLRYRHGITNTNQCPEGLSAADEYRVVQTQPYLPEWAPRQYFAVSLGPEYYLINEFGIFQVYQRKAHDSRP